MQHTGGDHASVMLIWFIGRVVFCDIINAQAYKPAPAMEYQGDWGCEVLDRPSESPDLSPIENICDEIS
jgi:hypothetical protein